MCVVILSSFRQRSSQWMDLKLKTVISADHLKTVPVIFAFSTASETQKWSKEEQAELSSPSEHLFSHCRVHLMIPCGPALIPHSRRDLDQSLQAYGCFQVPRVNVRVSRRNKKQNWILLKFLLISVPERSN